MAEVGLEGWVRLGFLWGEGMMEGEEELQNQHEQTQGSGKVGCV